MSDMPKEIWAISKVWCGNPKSKVSYTISCIDADDSPRGIKYIRADVVDELVEACEAILGIGSTRSSGKTHAISLAEKALKKARGEA